MENGRNSERFGIWLAFAWLGYSVSAFQRSDHAAFEEAGAIAVMAGVVYFILTRRGQPRLNAEIASDAFRDRKINELSNALLVTNVNLTLLAKTLENQALQRKEQPSAVISALARVELSQPDPLKIEQYERMQGKIDQSERRSIAANNGVVFSNRAAEVIQAILVSLGTVQSAFGDRLIALISGNGWTVP